MPRPKGSRVSPRLAAMLGTDAAQHLTAALGEDTTRSLDVELTELEQLGKLKSVRFVVQSFIELNKRSERELAARLESVDTKLDQVLELVGGLAIARGTHAHVGNRLDEVAHQLANLVRVYGASVLRDEELIAAVERLALLRGDQELVDQLEALTVGAEPTITPAGPRVEAPAAIVLYRPAAAAAA